MLTWTVPTCKSAVLFGSTIKTASACERPGHNSNLCTSIPVRTLDKEANEKKPETLLQSRMALKHFWWYCWCYFKCQGETQSPHFSHSHRSAHCLCPLPRAVLFYGTWTRHSASLPHVSKLASGSQKRFQLRQQTAGVRILENLSNLYSARPLCNRFLRAMFRVKLH